VEQEYKEKLDSNKKKTPSERQQKDHTILINRQKNAVNNERLRLN